MASLSGPDRTFLDALIATHTDAVAAVDTYLATSPAGRLGNLTKFATMHRKDMTNEITAMRSWLAGKPVDMAAAGMD